MKKSHLKNAAQELFASHSLTPTQLDRLSKLERQHLSEKPSKKSFLPFYLTFSGAFVAVSLLAFVLVH